MTYGFSFHNACDVAANAAFLSAGVSFGWYLLKSLTLKVSDKI